MIKITTKEEPTRFYAIAFDLRFGKSLQQLLPIKDEAEFDEFIKKDLQHHNCIHDVGIQEVDNTYTILTFDKFKERYFNSPTQK